MLLHVNRLCSSLSALFSSTLIISLVFAVIPLCRHIAPLFITLAIAGSAMGVIDTIANLQLVNLYHRDSAVFLQVRKAVRAFASACVGICAACCVKAQGVRGVAPQRTVGWSL